MPPIQAAAGSQWAPRAYGLREFVLTRVRPHASISDRNIVFASLGGGWPPL